MIVILQKNQTLSVKEFDNAREDYKDFIKITIDIKQEIVALGGEYHADAEKILMGLGCLQKDIWGGGVDLNGKIYLVNAMVNLRPNENPSTDILNPITRKKFLTIAKHTLDKYV